MRKVLFGVFISAFLIACNNEKKDDQSSASGSTAPAPEMKKAATEVLDLSEADGVKASFAALTKGDVDGMTANYDDNIHYYWSGGDSVVGKTAAADYWKGRWKLLDSLTLSEVVVLPIKINESQSPQYARVGKWVLAWTFSHAKYKNGKTLHFWVHTDFHYNDAGKIDVAVQYIDRYPIMEATKDLMKK